MFYSYKWLCKDDMTISREKDELRKQSLVSRGFSRLSNNGVRSTWILLAHVYYSFLADRT